MINAMHAMIFAKDVDKTRAFLRDVLQLKHVDAGEGWLIFALPPAEVGVHPVEDGEQPQHRLYFMCDDIKKTMAELKGRKVEFVGDVQDQGWGLTIPMRVPGADDIVLYQPRHPSPLKPQK